MLVLVLVLVLYLGRGVHSSEERASLRRICLVWPLSTAMVMMMVISAVIIA